MKNQKSIVPRCDQTGAAQTSQKQYFTPTRRRRRWRRVVFAALLIPPMPTERVNALLGWINEVPSGEGLERQGLSQGMPTGMSALRGRALAPGGETSERQGLSQGMPTGRSAIPGVAAIRRCAIAIAIGAVAVAAALCGCQSISYTSPTGEKFNRVSVGSKLAIGSLSVTPDTNGTRGIELRGYENDSAQAIGTLTEAAVRGALSGVMPRPVSP